MKRIYQIFFVLLCTSATQAQVNLGVNVSPALAGTELKELNPFSIGGGFSAGYRVNERIGIGADFNFNPFKGDSLQISVSVLQMQITPVFYQEINRTSEVYFTPAAGIFFGRYSGVNTVLESHVMVGVTPRLGYAVEIGPGTDFYTEIFYGFTPFPDENFAEGSNYLVGDYHFYGLHFGITHSLADL